MVMAGDVVLHVPPVMELLKVVVLARQTLGPPSIGPGFGLMVTGWVAAQPEPAV